jgi:hypothetical protein
LQNRLTNKHVMQQRQPVVLQTANNVKKNPNTAQINFNGNEKIKAMP